jgi:ABC-type polysaccharide/polyol phosphate export permease
MAVTELAVSRQVLFWVRLGWYDILSRYRSTVLGVFWIVLVNGLTVFAIGFVYASLFGVELQSYFPYLTVGYISWLWISTTLLEVSSSFTAYRFILVSHAVDPVAIIARVFSRNFIILLHNLPIMAVVLLLYAGGLHTTWLLFPISLVIVSLFLVGVGGALAFLCARFHDVQMIISAVVGVLFLVTPIIWSPDILKERAYIATINPLRHVLDVLRKPLLGEVPDVTNYAVALGITAVSLVAFWLAYRAYRKRFIYWL